jgi:hypothetical protein
MIRLAAAVLPLALLGCAGTGDTYGDPARIVNPDDSSRATLQAAVNKALGTEVLLADDALTHSSVLTIERNVPGSISGQHAQGRNMDTPIQFRLEKHGNACVLIDQSNPSSYILKGVDCIAE